MKIVKWEELEAPVVYEVDCKSIFKFFNQSADVNARRHTNYSVHLMRTRIIKLSVREVYLSIIEERNELPNEVLMFGNLMVDADMCPSLIALNVPFGVRREWYEHYQLIESVIYDALNAKDKNYIAFRDFYSDKGYNIADKAKIAQALWRWYYSVFEPSAIKFTKQGTEHSKF